MAVHVFLIDAAGRILLMRRAGSGFADGRLGLPAGHVDLGETPTASAIREVGEELGIELDPQQLRPAGTMFRRSVNDGNVFVRGDGPRHATAPRAV